MMTLILIAMYFTPTFVAFVRGHASKWGIFASNFFFGWTIIGWVWCLIWSLSNKGVSQSVVVNNYGGGK